MLQKLPPSIVNSMPEARCSQAVTIFLFSTLIRPVDSHQSGICYDRDRCVRGVPVCRVPVAFYRGKYAQDHSGNQWRRDGRDDFMLHAANCAGEDSCRKRINTTSLRRPLTC